MRAEKKQLVQDIKGLIEPAGGLFLVSYTGLKVSDFTDLRNSLAEIEAELHVVPNKLIKIAAKELGYEDFANAELVGDTACAVAADPVTLAKKLSDFIKEHEQMQFKFGFVDGTLYSAADAAQFAKMPSKETLQAQLVGLLAAPASNLVRVLNAKNASILYALKAYLDKKSAE